MKTIELFSGTKSFSNAMLKHGHSTLTIDNECSLSPDICKDILDMTPNDISKGIDILWASPPCTAFSIASVGRHWNKDRTPKTENAKIAQEIVKTTLWLIEESKPKWWFIENPRGMLRKMPFMDGLVRRTISYCQYGDDRMKPTDIWTNAWWWNPKQICKNGDKCHISAPRGSKTGTQGLKNAKERGRIPEKLFDEIIEHHKIFL